MAFSSSTLTDDEQKKAAVLIWDVKEKLTAYFATKQTSASDTDALVAVYNAYIKETKPDKLTLAVLKNIVAIEVEGELGNKIEELSLKYFDSQQEFSGPDHLVPPGQIKIYESLVKDIKLVYNAEVLNITQLANKVTLTTKDGKSYNTEYVVVTVPLGYLKKNILKFSPKLSTKKQNAIGRLGMGVYEKVIIEFTEFLG